MWKTTCFLCLLWLPSLAGSTIQTREQFASSKFVKDWNMKEEPSPLDMGDSIAISWSRYRDMNPKIKDPTPSFIVHLTFGKMDKGGIAKNLNGLSLLLRDEWGFAVNGDHLGRLNAFEQFMVFVTHIPDQPALDDKIKTTFLATEQSKKDVENIIDLQDGSKLSIRKFATGFAPTTIVTLSLKP